MWKTRRTICTLTDEYLIDRRVYFTNYAGSTTTRPLRMAAAMKHFNSQFGMLPAEKFGPLMLEDFQRQCVDANLARTTINAYVLEVKGFFRWCVLKEKIDIAIFQALTTVPQLKQGRTRAKEVPPVKPVSLRSIWRLHGHIASHWYKLIWLHYYTAARPGEIISWKLNEIEQGEHVWTVHLDKHKNQWRGQERVIVMGPASQALLEPLIDALNPEDYIFSPNGGRTPYVVGSWRTAIYRACGRAGVPRWQPNQIRHAAATMVREKFGLEAAQAYLGHANIQTTQIYAERQQETAHKIAKEIG